MDLNASKVFQRAVDSVRIPLEHFIKTGFYDPNSLVGYEPEDIADFQVRRVCRQIAKEGKRPFIRCYAVESLHTFDRTTMRWEKNDKPKFEYGYVEVPKRKYLAPLVAPLLLAAPEAQGRYYANTKDGEHVWQLSSVTLWQFRVYGKDLWDKIYDYMLNDPECRKARRLTS